MSEIHDLNIDKLFYIWMITRQFSPKKENKKILVFQSKVILVNNSPELMESTEINRTFCIHGLCTPSDVDRFV